MGPVCTRRYFSRGQQNGYWRDGENLRPANNRPPPPRRQSFSVESTILVAASASLGVLALWLLTLLIVPTFPNSPSRSIRERSENLSEWCL